MSGETLNQVLARLGMRTESASFGPYAKRVLRADGTLFCEGRAGDVWEALHVAGLIATTEAVCGAPVGDGDRCHHYRPCVGHVEAA